MLPAKYKLSPLQIPFVARKGRKYPGKRFDIKVVQEDLLNFPKVAISVSVKVSKKAVVRNRIKRVLREAIRLLIVEDKLPNAKYLIVLKSATVSEDTPADLVSELSSQLKLD